jgi:hypothetical protein
MLKQFKQTSVFQEANGNCFLGQERSAYCGIHATWDYSNVRNVLQNTKRTAYGWPFRKKFVEC